MRVGLNLVMSAIGLCFPSWITGVGSQSAPTSILIKHGTIVDGTGGSRRKSDVRISGDTIIQIARKLTPLPGERIIDATGLVVAPGFIDTLSHADSGILDDPLAETQIKQGITTAVVGHDGASNTPLRDWFSQIENKHVALNMASFVGHGTVRHMAMGSDFKRLSTEPERIKMDDYIDADMKEGALGLSSGLEYDPGLYANTDELVECSKVAAKYGGMYVSHVRDEGDKAFDAFRELIHIAEEAKVPANISHIKLDTSPSWHRAAEVRQMMADARKRGVDITADVYPYTYWQSSIAVLSPASSWDNRDAWQKGLDEVGGPQNVLLGCYLPNPKWAGKTISQIAADTNTEPVSVIQEIVHKTYGREDKDQDSENVVVAAMTDSDVRSFVIDPHIMFCSDGSMDDTHPRGAGTFPRVLGYYVHDIHALSLEQAIYKMTGLSAQRMGFLDRGRIARGMKADITVFDPNTIHDTATTQHPQAAPSGIPYVLVNGDVVLDDYKITGERPGAVIRRHKRLDNLVKK